MCLFSCEAECEHPEGKLSFPQIEPSLGSWAAVFYSLQMSTEKDFCTFSSWVHNLAFKLGSVRSDFYFLLLLVFMVDSIMIINISLEFIIKENYIVMLEGNVETFM